MSLTQELKEQIHRKGLKDTYDFNPHITAGGLTIARAALDGHAVKLFAPNGDRYELSKLKQRETITTELNNRLRLVMPKSI